MQLIPSVTIADAWLNGCRYLLKAPQWTDTTVILHVEAPMTVRPQDRAVAAALDSFLASHNSYSSHTVAETIFPGYEYRRSGAKGVYEIYPEQIYPSIRTLPEVQRWGTYAYRLLRRRDPDGREYNPLEQCISKMRDRVPKYAAYEIGFGFGFDLATYDDDQDRSARMGGPCLSHLSFKLIGRAVHLTALYRSHFYVQRAYGNLLGLARLLAFVANEAGVTAGTIVCHSTMARLDHGSKTWSKADVSSLLEECVTLHGGFPAPATAGTAR